MSTATVITVWVAVLGGIIVWALIVFLIWAVVRGGDKARSIERPKTHPTTQNKERNEIDQSRRSA